MSESWKRDYESRSLPAIDDKVRMWFRRLTLSRLETSGSANDERIDRDAVADILVAQILDLVRWVPHTSYSGKGYSAGEWQEREGAFYDAFTLAIHEVRRAYDAEQYPTLDDWLRADAAGELLWYGEDGGIELIPKDMAERTLVAAERRRLRAERRAEKGVMRSWREAQQ